MRRCCVALLLSPVVMAAELNFQPVILDTTYIAYERDVGDIDGDLDIVGIRNWNAAPTYIYRKVHP